MAAAILERHDADGPPGEDLVDFADGLWGWVRARFGVVVRIRTEWPVALRLRSGTKVLGTADLVVETDNAVDIIDHKSYGLRLHPPMPPSSAASSVVRPTCSPEPIRASRSAPGFICRSRMRQSR